MKTFEEIFKLNEAKQNLKDIQVNINKSGR